jgi:hypothetical protein
VRIRPQTSEVRHQVFGERQDSFNVEFVESRVIHLNLSDGQTFSKIFLLFFIGPLIDRPVKDEHLIETAMGCPRPPIPPARGA